MGKGMNKVVATFVALLLAALLVPAVATPQEIFADDGVIVSVGAPNNPVQPADGYAVGSTFRVPVSIADNTGFAGYGFEATYDHDVFTLTNVTRPSGTLLNGKGLWYPNVDLDRIVGTYSDEDDFGDPIYECTDDGILFYLTFAVKSDISSGDYPISIHLIDDNAAQLSDWLAQSVSVTFSPSTIKVLGDTTPPTPDPAKISLIDGGYSAAPGEIFTVPVFIADNPGFFGASFTLVYDDTKLEIASVNATSGLFAGGLFYEGSTDVVFLGDSEAATDVTGNGKLFDVTFKVKDAATSGSTSIGIKLKDDAKANFANYAVKSIDVEFAAPISVTINPPAPPTGLTITVGDIAKAFKGQTIKVPVSIAGNPGFAGGDFKVTYPESLEFNGPVASSASSFVYANLDNVLDRVFFLSAADQTGNGVLFDLEFTVKGDTAPGSLTITLSPGTPEGFFGNHDEESLSPEFVSGTVTVLAKDEVTVDDLNYVAPSSLVYDGNQHVATVTKKNAEIGDITVLYQTGSEAATATAPTDAGTYTVIASIAESTLYAPAEITVGTFTVAKAAAPTITWPTAAAITYGQPLSAAILSGGSTTYGSFAYDLSATELAAIPDADTYNHPVVFTPSAATVKNYVAIATLTQDVVVTVNKAAAPTITWPTATPITYGQALSAATLVGGSTAYGSFAYAAGPEVIPPNAGTFNFAVDFTPSPATVKNYGTISPLTQNVSVTINKAAAPSITWPTAGYAAKGAALSTVALNGGSTEYGSFAWNPATTLVAVGGGSYPVTFTPSAATLQNYLPISPLTQNVTINATSIYTPGDADGNGRVNILDAIRLQKYVNLELAAPATGSLAFLALDVDGDELLTATDIVLLFDLIAAQV
jgi:hypothetical protein